MLTDARIRTLSQTALLALLFGMQLVLWPSLEDAFHPLEAAWIKLLMPLALLPLLADPRGLWARAKASPAAWAAAGFLLWLWVSASRSGFPRQGLKTALEYSLYGAAFFVPALLDLEGRRKAAAAWLAACLLAAAYGALQHFGLDFLGWNTDFSGRPLGTLGNPNFFAGHLVMAWALNLALLAAARTPRTRLLLAAALALLSAVQFWSVTMGAWLGMLAVAAAFAAWSLAGDGQRLAAWGLTRGRIAAGLLGLLLAAGAAFLLLPQGRAFTAKLKGDKAVSVVNRRMMWRVAVDMWKEAPLLGKGLASYRPLYPDFQSRILAREKGWNYVVTWLPHQNHLYWLAETGLIGLALYSLAWLLGLWNGIRRLARDPGDGLLLGAALAVVGIQAEGLLNTYSNIPPSAVAYWFLLGLLAFSPHALRSPQAAEPGPKRGRVALALALTAALFLGFFGLRQAQANRLLKEANRLSRAKQYEAAVPVFRKALGLGVWELSQQAIVGASYNLGEALRNLGRLEEARQAYAADLPENPHTPETHNMLGAVAGQLGRSTEALTLLGRCVELYPDYGAAWLNLGIARVQSGDRAGARQAWERVRAVEPGNVQAAQYLETLKRMK